MHSNLVHALNTGIFSAVGAALANCKLTLNTDWLVVHSPYVSLHVSAMKWNLWCLLSLGCLHNVVSLVYIQ